MSKISVVIIARNEAHRIARTLESARWANEIVVIDAFSSDGTPEVCRRNGAQVYQYVWEGFALQRRRSLQHASQPWILSLDADEVVSEELAQEIRAILRQAAPAAGYWVPRKTWYLGRWIEHGGWFPDFQLRLFRHEAVKIVSRPVHEGFHVLGNTERLRGVLYHYSYDDLADHVDKINRYTSLELPEKLAKLGDRKVRWHHILMNPLAQFVKMFVLKRGYRDGIPGLGLALMSALYTQMLYAKAWKHHQDSPQASEKERSRAKPAAG